MYPQPVAASVSPPIAEVGLSPWGVRSHFEEGKKQPSEFLNSGTVDILGQINDSEWLGALEKI